MIQMKKAAKAPTHILCLPVNKGCELVPLLLSSFGSFFHTYIHLILALSLRLQGICVEC